MAASSLAQSDNIALSYIRARGRSRLYEPGDSPIVENGDIFAESLWPYALMKGKETRALTWLKRPHLTTSLARVATIDRRKTHALFLRSVRFS